MLNANTGDILFNRLKTNQTLQILFHNPIHCTFYNIIMWVVVSVISSKYLCNFVICISEILLK